MPYSVTIEADSIRELTGKVIDLASQLGGATATVGEPEKQTSKKTPAPKAEKVEEKKPAATAEEAAGSTETQTSASADAAASAGAADGPVSTEDFTDKVRPLVLKLVEQKGRETMEGVLAQFGIQRASQVAEGQRAELLAALEDALNG